MKNFQNNDVKKVFYSYPEKYRQPLLAIRNLIFDVASKTEGVGKITETLKWEQPSYLTQETGAGTTIRRVLEILCHSSKINQKGNDTCLPHLILNKL